ncbi:hypothetical protein [Alicyclobacillus herbarius]|uniref:hypothetical protein n=1 Tax=Alicyclobacillus herbarius TaxID=122960 RepID=UPI000404E8C7|nr:hypothetical protein [Alicyclobacillus herbarius]
MAHFIDFRLGGMKLGVISGTSGVFTGNNLQYGWRLSTKSNDAIGRVDGDACRIEAWRNTVVDPDVLDTFIQKPLPFQGNEAPWPGFARMRADRPHPPTPPEVEPPSSAEWDW